jgi:hypothetical protein
MEHPHIPKVMLDILVYQRSQYREFYRNSEAEEQVISQDSERKEPSDPPRIVDSDGFHVVLFGGVVSNHQNVRDLSMLTIKKGPGHRRPVECVEV